MYLCTSEMKHFALIGKSLTHSYSKSIFDLQHFQDADYNLFSMPSLDGLRQWVLDNQISGFNVTNPYKQAILPLLDDLAPEARQIGAVNCVVARDGRLTGHNTDAPAFLQTLSPLPAPRQAFILGTGGAARAVAWALGQRAIPYTFVSRNPNGGNVIGYAQLYGFQFPSSTLIVNATPIGMYPDEGHSPLDLKAFHSPLGGLFFYDLIYNPSPSLLLRQAAALGAETKDGLEMLHLQAAFSWHLWGLL